MKQKLKKILQFILNPRLLLCLGIGWLITNGWSYLFLGLGTYFNIGWMIAVAGGYLTFLWLPISPEKIVTVLIAMGLMRLLFPKDQKTLGILRELRIQYQTRKKDRKRKKNEKSFF